MEYIKEILWEAREDLKRLEHIIYVSLKYTRTTDIIVNALNRLVNIYDLIIEAFLEKAKKEGLLEVLPKTSILKSKKLEELYPHDSELQKFLCFYHFLKNVLKLPSHKREEFRRHVTLVVEFEQSTAEIDIDNLTNCERFAHKFFNFARLRILNETDD